MFGCESLDLFPSVPRGNFSDDGDWIKPWSTSIFRNNFTDTYFSERHWCLVFILGLGLSSLCFLVTKAVLVWLLSHRVAFKSIKYWLGTFTSSVSPLVWCSYCRIEHPLDICPNVVYVVWAFFCPAQFPLLLSPKEITERSTLMINWLAH